MTVSNASAQRVSITFPFAPKEIPLGDKGESKRRGEGAIGMGMGYIHSATD